MFWETNEPINKKICTSVNTVLELPTFFFDSEKEETEKKDLREKYSGKVRQFEHVKGILSPDESDCI
jgi:hypothetical protein